MKVSIIVPVYNGEKYLEECLTTLVKQTYKNIEIIIIDDGSTDSTLDIVNDFEKRDSRVKKIVQKNSGPFIARNNGIDNSTGEYIMFVDSDDWIDEDAVEILVNYISKYNVDVVKFNYVLEPSKKIIYVDEETNKGEIVIRKDQKNYVYDLLIDSYKFNNLCNEIVRRNLCSNCKINANLRMGEDFLLNCQILTLAENVLLVNDSLYHYRMNSSSSTHKIDYLATKKNLNDILFVYKNKYEYLILWGYDDIIDKNRLGIRLIDFVVEELFKIYKINKTDYSKLDDIYDLIFLNNTFNELTKDLNNSDIQTGNFIKRNFKRRVLQKNKKILNKYVFFVKIVFLIKKIFNIKSK